jgi:hypothetical protein
MLRGGERRQGNQSGAKKTHAIAFIAATGRERALARWFSQ